MFQKETKGSLTNMQHSTLNDQKTEIYFGAMTSTLGKRFFWKKYNNDLYLSRTLKKFTINQQFNTPSRIK